MANLIPTRLVPKLITVLKEGYGWPDLGRDALAGLIVGIVALPLAIAFAIASGVKPEQGIYTAIIAGFLISALGGSRVQVGGPTGAFVVIVYGIVAKYGYDGLAAATLMAGVMLVLMGVLRLGGLVKFVPYPLTVGFTTGIAVIIAITQVRDFLGLTMEQVPALFLPKLKAYASAMHTLNPWTVGVSLLALAITIFWPKLTKRVPGSLVAIVATTLVVQLFHLDLNQGVQTIGSRFGEVPSGFPAFRLPNISYSHFTELFNPAISIALLAALESLLSAVVADGMTGRRHRSDMEIVAQGVANIASPLFGGIPATGAIARTATNIKNGARTPVAGMVHALVLLVILLVAGKWASLIPMGTLGAILLVVAYNMSELHMFKKLLKAPRSDVLVLLTSFFLTVLIDLTVAIEVGFLLAMALFIKRISEVSEVREITLTLHEGDGDDDPDSVAKRRVPPGVEVYELFGSFFFGAADKFKSVLAESSRSPKILILRMRHMVSLDATGMRAIEEMHERSVREKWSLILSGVHAQPMTAMVRSGLADQIGMDNLCANIDVALARAVEIQAAGVEKKSGPIGAVQG
ncbi:MAG TPA: sulfate permease [Fibrobacteria bacterium]|nr:sulfate permease [Fibrobacteria bacterium]